MFQSDLDRLLKDLPDPTTQNDVLVIMELEDIRQLLSRCKKEEWQFAAAISHKFCQVIRLMQEQYRQELAEAQQQRVLSHGDDRNMGFMTMPLRDRPAPFQTAEHLLHDFYHHFCNEEQNVVEYEYVSAYIREEIAPLEQMLVEEQDPARRAELQEKIKNRKQKINLTMRDYAARIKTFATASSNKPYLQCMLEQGMLGEVAQVEDPVLFTYCHIEQILARFDTKENGEVNKQKSNICSALRKLNQFKRDKEG